jgi:YidC/Oxa1 family membrane protein insertase
VNNQRNLILAIILTGLLLFGWDAGVRYFYPHANQPEPVTTQTAATTPAAIKPTREGGLVAAADVALEAQDLKTALASPARVPIVAPGL